MRRTFIFLSLAGFLTMPGCFGSTDPSLAEVKGTVRLDGEPISDGTITFFPAEGVKGPTAGGGIVDGKYTVSRVKGVAVGKNKVEILANRKTGRKVPDPSRPGTERDEVKQFVPEKYNIKSELFEDVQPGTNTIDFDLAGK